MASAPPCSICNSRKSRRSCPVKGEICPQCCGRDREETIDCPVDCAFLVESRIRGKLSPVDTNLYADLRPSEEFVYEHENLFVAIALAVFGAGLETPECIDRDLEECLDASIRNRRSRESGLIYDGKPENRIAADLLEKLDRRLDEFRARSAEWKDHTPASDADLLKMLVFVRVFSTMHNNGRSRSRGFLHFLYGVAAQHIPDGRPEGEGSRIS